MRDHLPFKSRALHLAPRGVFILLVLALCGCAATVRENHFFAAYRATTGTSREPAQFYRVGVEGNSYFSSTRYLTGYFDERAVSLFFNEIKGTNATNNRKLFNDDMVSAKTKLAPLAPTATNGAFVMIMSSNVDAVANTIGSFAESQVVADALTQVFNRERVMDKNRSDALLTVDKTKATAMVAQLSSQTAAATNATRGDAAAASYLQALTTLARNLGYTGPQFPSSDNAREWFALEGTTNAGRNP